MSKEIREQGIKVICRNCVNFNAGGAVSGWCRRNDITIDYIYGGPNIIYKRTNDKDYPNKTGNCSYYKRKWYKFWI